MALGKRSSSMNEKRSGFSVEEEVVLSYTRLCGSKRVYLESPWRTPSPSVKSSLCRKGIFDWEMQKLSPLESLPRDILVKIVCGVDHDDLKRLTHVSRTIRDASMIAKECHFEYRTPKKARVFGTPIDCVVSNEGFEEMEAPNAPKQVRSRKLCSGGKDLSEISVVLFASPRRKGLFTETPWRWNV